MKRIYEVFTDKEFKKLLRQKGKISWHDWIIWASNFAFFNSKQYEESLKGGKNGRPKKDR